MRALGVILLIFISGCITIASSAEVVLTINKRTYTFNDDIRLSTALSVVALKENWYWSASSIYRIKPTNPHYTKNSVQQRLIQLTKTLNYADTHQQQLTEIIDQMLQWQYAERLDVIVDYDLARINRQYNPLLTDGHYLIHLQTRPNYIRVLGAVNLPGIFDYQTQQHPEFYIEQAGLTDITNKDYVFVVEPDGTTKKVGIAYWNKEDYLLIPGSTIVGLLSEALFSDDEHRINQELVDLARNRVNVP